MRKASWMAVLAVGLWHSGAVCAEDSEADAEVGNHAGAPAQTLDVSVYAFRDESPWYLAPRIDAVAFPDDQPFPEVEFQDMSALGRLRRLRSLSLLTFAEVGGGRLFFGVNGDGLLGLHFGLISEDGEQRQPELIRMPYLDEGVSEAEDQ